MALDLRNLKHLTANFSFRIMIWIMLCLALPTDSKPISTTEAPILNITQSPSLNISSPSTLEPSEPLKNCTTFLDLLWQRLGENASIKDLMLTLQREEVHGRMTTLPSPRPSSKVEEQQLQRPRNLLPTAVGPPHVKYRLYNRLWEAPKGADVNGKPIQFDDPPLPYTGAYNDDGVLMVNINGKHVRFDSLSYWERIKRSGTPWCIKTPSEKAAILKQLLKAEKKCRTTSKRITELEEQIKELEKTSTSP
ncbi:IE-G [Saimiriine gammaherpesvirus 2]|uniref:Immediate-early protein IE-G n=1 Tax=Saimiriine herpesvirus 2 (strain 11) TaxID=10383 RepID=VIEG_SHV21|nr:IE-G [Saimiriine gammaherpesvirus 2]Q00997.1 RecName: Full=Immediate-early protein IE-G [Herpesvirus saimiri (strain 11)]pir/A45351/ immediate-early protein 1 - saimiriine herpesvirus 1 (strain 11) [Saimiriine alphaherpesvirus 1]AAA46155.1 immediate-early protein [Saimiriine gammaherpesvirus 2]CAA45637.1 IE-G [Saimiriine gammaherpesvirus 2]